MITEEADEPLTKSFHKLVQNFLAKLAHTDPAAEFDWNPQVELKQIYQLAHGSEPGWHFLAALKFHPQK